MKKMIKSVLHAIAIVTFITGCTSYQYTTIKQLKAPLDPTKRVLVATPEDGWFENTQHLNSGNMTAHAIKVSFEKHAHSVKQIKSHDKDELLSSIDSKKYGYLALPKIKHWEERATEWSGIPDRIKINLEIYDCKTKRKLAEHVFSGKSKWFTLGGDHPQELLAEPVKKIVNSYYK
jgi:hypothetical protein